LHYATVTDCLHVPARIAKLDEQQQSILHQLKMTLPERLEPLRIQKCSENSAIA